MLTSERKGHILPVHLEPTTIPLGLKYPLAGIHHIEYYHGDPEENLQAILRSLDGLGVQITPPQAAAGTGAGVRSAATIAANAAEPVPETRAVAVLPFDNISPDPETDYFSDGLTEELIARLSLVSEINLISRWASMQHKGRGQDIHAVGAALGARYIVGGGVRRFQDSVRITVQLVDVATNLQLWGNTYKGKLDDIFDIQEQVAQQIVEALKLKLSFSERLSLTKRPTLNAEAYRAMGLSYFLWGKLDEATASCTKAVEIDPDDFIAHWTLGRIYFRRLDAERSGSRVVARPPGVRRVAAVDAAALGPDRQGTAPQCDGFWPTQSDAEISQELQPDASDRWTRSQLTRSQ